MDKKTESRKNIEKKVKEIQDKVSDSDLKYLGELNSLYNVLLILKDIEDLNILNELENVIREQKEYCSEISNK